MRKYFFTALFAVVFVTSSFAFAKDLKTESFKPQKKRTVAKSETKEMALDPNVVISVINEQIALNLPRIELTYKKRIDKLSCPKKFEASDIDHIKIAGPYSEDFEFSATTLCWGSNKKIVFVELTGMLYQAPSEKSKNKFEYLINEFGLKMREDVDSI